MRPAIDCVEVVLATKDPDLERLARAVDSVLSQDGSTRVVLVDDGSAFPVAAWPSEPRVQVLRTAGVGVSAARNLGLRHTSASLIAFLDDDDEWLAGKLDAQRRHLAARPELLLSDTEFCMVAMDGTVLNDGFHSGHRDVNDLLDGCGMCLSSVVVRRQVLDIAGFFREDLRAGEDWEWFLRIAAAGPVGRVPQTFVRYLLKPDNPSRRYAETWRAARLIYRRHLLHGHDRAERTAAFKGYLRVRRLVGTQAFTHARNSRKAGEPFLVHAARAMSLAPWACLTELASHRFRSQNQVGP